MYFQTGEYYLKTIQIRTNPNVAISLGTYEMEGVAEIIGHPMDEANRFILEKLKVKHPEAVTRWSEVPNQIVVKVKIKLARQWHYKEGKPYIAIGRFDSL